MANEPTSDDDLTIRAAGGIVFRDRSRRELAVVFRSRYGDRCLPKGKLDPGEDFEAGAVREVHEETGLTVSVVGPAGELRYEVDGRPKVVRWFEMLAESDELDPLDGGEVERVEWWTVERALDELSYDSERGLIADLG